MKTKKMWAILLGIGILVGTSLSASPSANDAPDAFDVHLTGVGVVDLVVVDGDLAALSSKAFGDMKGTIGGAYKADMIALAYQEEGETSKAKVSGRMTLTSPDNIVASNSEYGIVFNGWIDKCCGQGNFNFEGTFESISATGRFAGTKIQGNISATGDLGYTMNLHLKGQEVSGV